MTDGLVQRLRGFIAFEGMSLPIDLEKAVREAAVTIERLQADNAALQKQVAEARNKAIAEAVEAALAEYIPSAGEMPDAMRAIDPEEIAIACIRTTIREIAARIRALKDTANG